MRRPLVLSLAGLLACGLGTAAMAADLSLQPTTILLDAQRDRGAVQVHNRGTEAVTLQADAQGWVRADGQDIDSATSKLMINPPLFTLPPGGTQLVRVGLRRGAEADAERETLYRLVLRELPPQPAAGDAMVSGQVRVLVTLRLPVYVAPRQVRRDAKWTLAQDASGGYVAHVTNTGNVHLRLASLRLQEEGAKTLAEHGPSGPLFPGETRQFALHTEAGAAPRPSPSARPLQLEVRTPDEVRHVDVALATR